jgi:hypothetical protein
MSYVQGTKVQVIGTFRDPDTKALIDPPDVIASIWRPTATVPTSVREYVANTGVTRLSLGKYATVIDTTPEGGEWRYVFEATGPSAIAKLERLRVRARPEVVV